MNYHFTSSGCQLTHKASPIPNAFRHAPACGEMITHSAWADALRAKIPDTSYNYNLKRIFINNAPVCVKGIGCVCELQRRRHDVCSWHFGNPLYIKIRFCKNCRRFRLTRGDPSAIPTFGRTGPMENAFLIAL
jgi:hypothetical protein